MIIIFKGKEFDTEKEEVPEENPNDQNNASNLSGIVSITGMWGFYSGITGMASPINPPMIIPAKKLTEPVIQTKNAENDIFGKKIIWNFLKEKWNKLRGIPRYDNSI
jgi:nitrogen fixation protein